MKAFVSLLFFCLISPCYADPSVTIRKLMNEPLTMFDWGLYQLNEYFKTYPFDDLDLVRAGKNEKGRTIDSEVSYDWDRNRLIIKFYIRTSKQESEKYSAKDLCSNVTEKIRKSFVFDNYPLKSFAGLSRFFEHRGFNTYKDEQEKISRIAEIEKIIYITIDVSFSNFDNSSQFSEKIKAGTPLFTNILTCESPLLGKDIYYVDRK